MSTEPQTIEDALNQLTFPPLTVVGIGREPSTLSKSPQEWSRGADLILELEWKGDRQRFVVESKQRSTPSVLEGAIQQMSRYRAALRQLQPDSKLALMIIIPYLSPEALNRLSSEDLSGIDLSGNGIVTIPGKWFIYRTGADNRFPSSTPIKNVFSGASSQVPSVFLVRRAFATVSDVQEEIQRRSGSITLPTVSKVLKTLQDELMIERRDEIIRLIDAGRILDRLSKNYTEPRVRRRLKIKAPEGSQLKFKINAEKNGLLIAGNSPSQYVVFPGAEAMPIYTTSIDKLLQEVEFTETTRFPDFELIETIERKIYFDRRERDGFYWLSPVQVYLELAAGGKRERETASQLRESLINASFT